MSVVLSEGFSQEVFQKFIGELYVSRIVDVIDMKGLKALEVYKTGALSVVANADCESVTPEAVANSTVTLTADVQDLVSAKVSMADASQTAYDMIGEAAKDAAIALSESYEETVLAALVDGGTESAAADLTKTTVFPAILVADAALSAAKAPRVGRYILVNPSIKNLLLQSSDYTRQSDLSQAKIDSGVIGQVAGMDVYESVYLPATVNFIVGSNKGAKVGLSLMAFKQAESTKGFCEFVNGLNVYGTAVMDAEFIQYHSVGA